MARLKKLEHWQMFCLQPKRPFSFDSSFHKPDHYPSSDTAWEPGIRWQTMLWEGETLGLKFENKGTIENPKINLHIFSERPLSKSYSLSTIRGGHSPTSEVSLCLSKSYLDSLVAEVKFRYGLDSDLTEFIEKFKNDKQLGLIIKKMPGMRPMSPQSLYEYLVIGIMLQNCTVKRSVGMTQTLFEKYGTLLEYDRRKFYCFWEPRVLEKVTEEELRSLKIGYRSKSLKRITTPFVKNEIDELELRKKTKEEQKEALLELYGIGPATVGYILFDVFKHYDELSHISPWEQKIYSKIFFNRDPEKPVSVEKLLQFFEKRFGKYKMLAVHYLWEDLWWKRKNENIPWLEKLIRL